MTSSRFLRQGTLQAIFLDGFWKSDHDFLIAFLGNLMSAMHCFRDIEVVLPTGYDVIVISPLPLQAIFHDGFWKNDHDLLIAFYSNFVSGMHGFWDNEVLLPSEYDVIVISPLGGISHRFCWRNLKERPKFHNQGSLTYFAYLLPFLSYSTFYFGW